MDREKQLKVVNRNKKDGLFLKRPNPIKVKKNQKAKVVSIGMQLKQDSLPDEIVNEWADEWHDLNTGDLSSSKRKDIDRQDWLYRLNRGDIPPPPTQC